MLVVLGAWCLVVPSVALVVLGQARRQVEPGIGLGAKLSCAAQASQANCQL